MLPPMDNKTTPPNSKKAPPPKAYDQLPKESPKAWAAFRTYLSMGHDRSVRGVGRKVKKSTTLIARWSVRNNWVERTRVFDEENEAKMRKAEEAVMKEEAKLWNSRQRELRKRGYDIGVKLIAKAEEMLSHPLTRTITKHQGKTTIVEPVNWTAGNIGTLFKIGNEIARLSVGLHTEKAEITGADNAPIAMGQVVILELPDNGRTRKAEPIADDEEVGL